MNDRRIPAALVPRQSGLLLSDWLEHHGQPLNTRCGGRGLCRGCLVQLSTPAAPDPPPQRACQTDCATLPADLDCIQIAATSIRDASLHGVTTFELRHAGPTPAPRPGVGLALDIGTTTVAGALWDFPTGRLLADASRPNAQRRHGDDVVTRITFAVTRPDGLDRLRHALVHDTLAPLIDQLLARAALPVAAITQATAAGNPAMLHTLAGASLAGLATFPFRPVFLGGRTVPPAEHRLALACPVELIPGLGPFVGSDITAGALATGLLADDGPALLIDFGTNGEILLKHAGGYLATATAAGPAFEGGRLSCGAAAGPGVVSTLRRENNRWQPRLVPGSTGPAAGLSGAAYVDLLALGRREGWLNSFGRLDPRHAAVIRGPDHALRIQLSDTLFVTEPDIAELMQAKAAIAAGALTLLDLAGLRPADLRALHVAGGFGFHLDPDHALAIGLFPSVPRDSIRLAGNSSLGGASLLLHRENAPDLADLLDRTTVVELNQAPTFADNFTDCLSLYPFA